MCGSGAIAAALGARPGDVHGLDATAGEWAFGPPHSVLIQVPQANEAARWLAAKLGYREGFRGPQRMVEADMNDVAAPAPQDGDESDETRVVTLGKRIGKVTWRLMAPVPPF